MNGLFTNPVPDFSAITHLHANLDHPTSIFCPFLVCTLLLVPVASVFVALVFGILSKTVSIFLKLFLNSVRILKHIPAAKLAPR